MAVEDEPALYDLLLKMFEIWGIDGEAFTNGEQAVNWIDSVDAGRFKGDLPELAIIDIYIPEGLTQGHMVARRLRESPVLYDITIVLVSAFKLSPDEKRELMDYAIADAFIAKPLPHINEFRQQLEDHINRRRARPKQAFVRPPTPMYVPELPKIRSSEAHQSLDLRRRKLTPPTTLPESPANGDTTGSTPVAPQPPPPKRTLLQRLTLTARSQMKPPPQPEPPETAASDDITKSGPSHNGDA
jgi:CheY-like chemotaxis protein